MRSLPGGVAAFETMYRMYGHRAFDLVTVSINYPDEKAGVEKVLTAEHATSTNLILSSTDIYPQLAAFDPDWNAAVPYTLLIRPDGEIAYKMQGHGGSAATETTDHCESGRRRLHRAPGLLEDGRRKDANDKLDFHDLTWPLERLIISGDIRKWTFTKKSSNCGARDAGGRWRRS